MKVNGNKVKKVVLLMALIAPMVYLFGTLFEALKGSNGTITLAQEQEEFVPSSTYEESVNASLAVNPYNADYVFDESSFHPSNVYGKSIVKNGVIVDSQPTAFLSVGVNLWDETWEVGSIYDNGVNNDGITSRIRSKGYIRISPSMNFYYQSSKSFYIFYYDEGKNFISNDLNFASTTKTSPSNAYYVRFYMPNNYGVTYNHDICINVSNPDFNGNYYPYAYHEYGISFPVLKSAGSVCDDLQKVNVRSIDLGSLTYTKESIGTGVYRFYATLTGSLTSDLTSGAKSLCSKYDLLEAGGTYSNNNLGYTINGTTLYIRDGNYDSVSAGGFKTAMSGVILNYALAIPSNQLSISLPNMLPIFSGGLVYVKSNLVNDFQGQYKMYEGEYVINSVTFSDYLFNQFFAHDNFLAASGRNVIDGTPDYGFKPAGDLIRFVDGNMFHLANVEYGALVIGYTYYAFHVVCVFLIFNLLMFFPHLIENIYEKFERGW